MKKRPEKEDRQIILDAYNMGREDFEEGREAMFPDNLMLSNAYASGWADAALGEHPTDEEIVNSIWGADSQMN
jgi:hypothetical protein